MAAFSPSGHELRVDDVHGAHFELGAAQTLALEELDVVHLRQDPPFDMAYVTTTHILDHIHPKTLVVNDPASVRNAPEKLFVTEFPELMPPTLITRSFERLKEFRSGYGDIIVKPLYGNGGAAVFRLSPGDTNAGSLVELFQTVFREPFVVQRYLPEVRQGDKRIILVDGKPVGAINRVPAADETRSNMHVGGRPEAAQLTSREREICEAIGPELSRARSDLRRDRCDRRLSDRNQRHLANRDPRSEALRRPGYRGADLGRCGGQDRIALEPFWRDFRADNRTHFS